MTKNKGCKKTKYLGASAIILVPICIFMSQLWLGGFNISPFMFTSSVDGMTATEILVAYLLRHPDSKNLGSTPILAYNECLICNHEIDCHDDKTKQCTYNPRGDLYHSICGCTKFVKKTQNRNEKLDDR